MKSGAFGVLQRKNNTRRLSLGKGQVSINMSQVAQHAGTYPGF